MIFLNFLALILIQIYSSESFLYPIESASRQVKSLNGLWKFKVSPTRDQDAGFREQWFNEDFDQLGDSYEMPVPASYNDITTNSTIRDYVGWVWYQTEFYVENNWLKRRAFLYFGAVDHHAIIWCNGVKVMRHKGGHVAFVAEITEHLQIKNTIVVAINNTLTNHTIPQGFFSYPNETSIYPPGYFTYRHNCDYFDYAGINRNVFLYSTPNNYISDIDFVASYKNATGIYDYRIISSSSREVTCYITIKDFKDKAVAKSNQCSGRLEINGIYPWWPRFHQNKRAGTLYKVEVELVTDDDSDVYYQEVGFRSIGWSSEGFYINGEPIYLKGFGMHEDSDVRGRGFDPALMVRDLNLLDWVGANCIRTSHYPYSEEFIRAADKAGLAVILEVPACSLDNFDDEILKEHTRRAKEIILKYCHHPSVIIWSLANEPTTNVPASENYFKTLKHALLAEDITRPYMIVTSQKPENEKAVGSMDIICVNRYSGWYQDGGRLELIEYQVQREITAWKNKFNKTIIMCEYGAGSVTGLHTLPGTMWTEDYQVQLLKEHFKVFDKLKAQRYLSGEMIWNLIDFNTPQEYIRPGKCVKGVFTRQRNSKSASYTVRARYKSLQ